MLRHDSVGPEVIRKLLARFVECLAELLTCSVSAEERVLTVAGKRQFTRLSAFVETYAAFLYVRLEGLGIDNSQAGEDIFRFRMGQENYGLSRV